MSQREEIDCLIDKVEKVVGPVDELEFTQIDSEGHLVLRSIKGHWKPETKEAKK